MEISNISRIGGGFVRGLAIGALIAASACATSRKHTPGPETYGPPAEPSHEGSAPAPGEVYGPIPVVGPPAPPAAPFELLPNPDRVVLVFGHGLTHGYAYVGVLRALHEMKVPIQAIYGTEVGALAGALYFTQPNPNRVDWALLRFTEKNLGPREGKFSFGSPEKDLDSKLREVFADQRIETYREKLHIELGDAKTGEVLEARSGDLWQAVRGALAGANQFSPVDFEGHSVRASLGKISETYRLARQTEKYPVIVVVAGEPPNELFRKLLEEQRAILLYIPLPGIDDRDLKKRNQAVFAGKNAVHKSAKEVLDLIGRKPE